MVFLMEPGIMCMASRLSKSINGFEECQRHVDKIARVAKREQLKAPMEVIKKNMTIEETMKENNHYKDSRSLLVAFYNVMDSNGDIKITQEMKGWKVAADSWAQRITDAVAEGPSSTELNERLKTITAQMKRVSPRSCHS
ncbi:hypothetical protein SAMD00019534_107660 [Acytostelium subglobosum LB1]|uniref:hypothetical protein n=1 Tax=Acytostelium subglobosum LB1 TaxID=1410327 RepID=UPI000644D01B|nr:hypothetical protein SAMD00019534_107660 [Acytostelium subglobosum LB1]GAM27590.1 hypothetical protein SAMD00019534_107660 [Acytostelium subglobosum LB1]|eukprot:XP_012749655.1 hypothetical protein SAMD00019534_107660 [Acytostelium subglobosum LB1]